MMTLIKIFPLTARAKNRVLEHGDMATRFFYNEKETFKEWRQFLLNV